jgi:hypothetical protein
LPNATIGESYAVTINVTGATSVSSNADLLDGMAVSSTSATSILIQGTPTLDLTTSRHSFTLTETYPTVDGGTYTATQVFLLSTDPAGPGYEITAAGMSAGLINGSIALPPATEGTSYSDLLSALGANSGDQFTFDSVVTGEDGATNSWLSVSDQSGQYYLVGTPPAGFDDQSINVIIRAKDTTTGVIESRVFQLPIDPTPTYPSLTVVNPLNLPDQNATSLPLASPGIPYEAEIVASGGTGSLTVTWTVSDDNLLSNNLSIQQSSNGDGLIISGTPTLPTTFDSQTVNVTVTDANGNSTTEGYPLNILYTPAQIRQAYGLNDVALSGGVLGTGAGQTVAIVVSSDDLNLVSSTDPNFKSSDLYQYDQMMGIDTYTGTSAGPQFVKLNEFGGTSYPDPSNGSSGEITQDALWVHTLAPEANIILIEAASGENSDFFTAFTTAMT